MAIADLPRRHRSFHAATSEHVPLSFDMGAETFECVPKLPVGILADLTTGGTRGLPWILDFLRAVLATTDDEERFEEMIRSKDVIVDGEMLSNVVDWLLEEYTGRPTTPPRNLRPGRSSTGKGSKSGARRGVSTPPTSEPGSS